MRTTILGIFAACVIFTSTLVPAAAPIDATDTGQRNIGVSGEREPDRWQGRHHYLYDDENQPNTATVGSALLDVRSCGREPVLVRRADGSTVVRRINRCD